MSKYFFDTYALVELMSESENYQKYKDVKIITTTLNLMEFYYFLLKECSKERAGSVLEKMNAELINIVKLDYALESADFRYKNKKLALSYIDCLGYTIAKKFNLKFLTGDKEFENMDNVEFVK